MPLQTAQRTAARIAAELTPYCDRIEIAGSIRRLRPFCNDVDLVVIPKPGQAQAFRDRCSLHAPMIRNGQQFIEVRLANGLLLDVWIAHPGQPDLLNPIPSNWGSLYLSRTGSREHNIYLVERAKSLGLAWRISGGIFNPQGEIIASATEQDIFRALQLDYIEPQSRER